MEWRYFLSATAQSMAAIIGIMGALLVALVLYEIRERRESRFKLRILLADSRKLEAGLPPFTKTLEAFLGQRLRETREMFKNLLLKEDGPTKSPEEYLDQMANRVSKYEDPERVLNLIRNSIQHWENTDGKIGEGNRDGTPQSQIDKELRDFDEKYQSVLHHVRSVNTLRSRIESSSMRLSSRICVALPILFALTVGLPLFLIPSDPTDAAVTPLNSFFFPKPTLVLIMLLTVSALCFFVWRLTKRDQIDKDDLVALERFSSLDSYSRHFERAWLAGDDSLY